MQNETPYSAWALVHHLSDMAFVLSEFVVNRRDDFEFDNLELMWLEIKIGRQKLFFGIGYRPPGGGGGLLP